MKKIELPPLTDKIIKSLRAGQQVLISGIIYTARDQAHKRLASLLKKGKKLPFDLKGQIVYYCGPTPAKKGEVIGSCGPTTSSRMDEFTPLLLKAGLKGMIGKGRRSQAVREAIKKYRAVYFLTYAGCGALLSTFVKRCEPIAYPDLGTEAIYKLEVENFPLIVGIDAYGKDIY
ncbi:MAG: FumA C-terminus/TtdB family hydratase beta subunit [Candidatus Omnitrophota bacterium]